MRHPERSEGSRFWLRVNSVKTLTKSMRYKTEILRLRPQNDNCDTVANLDNDRHWNTKEKQLFRMDTKVSCPELFGTNRNVRLKADIIIKRRGGEPANQD